MFLEIAVFSPNQDKSATDNAGTFGGDTGSILYLLEETDNVGMDAEQIAEAKDAAVMPRRADTISEAQTVITQLVKQKNTFTNKATNISVIISGKTIKKLGFLKDNERVYPPVIHVSLKK